MPFPPFNTDGNMPPGVYKGTLEETVAHFGAGSDQRAIVSARLRRVYSIVLARGRLHRFVVYGSFVTAKRDPRDVDIFFLMEDDFDSGALVGEAAILFDHRAAQDHFGASVFWASRRGALGGEQLAIEDWQVCRGGGRRGIVEIVEAKS